MDRIEFEPVKKVSNLNFMEKNVVKIYDSFTTISSVSRLRI